VKESENPTFSYKDLSAPPAGHADGGLWLAHQAHKEGDEVKALALLSDLADAGDELALDTQAKIYFNQKRYEEALEIWIKSKNSRTLEIARGQFIELELLELQYRADEALFEMRPEEYATWYAHSLNAHGEFEAAMELLEDSIQKYPNSDQKSTWYRLIGDFYRDQKDWVNAEIYYQQALSTRPVDSKAEVNLEGMYKLKKDELNRDGN
jgi:tetratricopeptide (TPR) repeat protein